MLGGRRNCRRRRMLVSVVTSGQNIGLHYQRTERLVNNVLTLQHNTITFYCILSLTKKSNQISLSLFAVPTLIKTLQSPTCNLYFAWILSAKSIRLKGKFSHIKHLIIAGRKWEGGAECKHLAINKSETEPDICQPHLFWSGGLNLCYSRDIIWRNGTRTPWQTSPCLYVDLNRPDRILIKYDLMLKNMNKNKQNNNNNNYRRRCCCWCWCGYN